MKSEISFLLLLPIFLYGQDTISTKKYDWAIKFLPIDLRTIWISIEKKIAHKTCVQSDLGYIFLADTKSDEGKIGGVKINYNKPNFNSKIEWRYYYSNSEKEFSGWYVAPQLFFNEINYRGCTSCFEWRPDTPSTSFFVDYYCYDKRQDNFSTKRMEYGMHIKMGHQKISVKRNFLWDFYFGAGFRAIDIQTKNFNGTVEAPYNWDRILGWPFDNWYSYKSEYHKLVPSFSLGFKIGFFYKHKK